MSNSWQIQSHEVFAEWWRHCCKSINDVIIVRYHLVINSTLLFVPTSKTITAARAFPVPARLSETVYHQKTESHFHNLNNLAPTQGTSLSTRLLLTIATRRLCIIVYWHWITAPCTNAVIDCLSGYQLLYGVQLCASMFCAWSSPSTLFLSALSFLTHLQIIILYADQQMTLNFSHLFSCSLHLTILLFWKLQFQFFSKWTFNNFLTLNSFKTEFHVTGLPQQLSKLGSPTIRIVNLTMSLSYIIDSARNLGVISDTTFIRSTHLICFEIMLPQSSKSPTHTEYDWSH